MDYEAWERSLPEAMTGDPLWKMQSYRMALYIADLGWEDGLVGVTVGGYE